MRYWPAVHFKFGGEPMCPYLLKVDWYAATMNGRMGDWEIGRNEKTKKISLSHSPTPPFSHSPTLYLWRGLVTVTIPAVNFYYFGRDQFRR